MFTNICNKKKIFIKAKELTETMNHQLAEQIDQQLLRATQSAAKLFSSKSSAPWSEVLHQSRLKLQILRHQLTQLRTRIDMTVPIQNLQQKIDFDMDIPQSLHNATEKFKELKIIVRQNIKNATSLRQEHLHQCKLKAVDTMD